MRDEQRKVNASGYDETTKHVGDVCDVCRLLLFFFVDDDGVGQLFLLMRMPGLCL